jgi:hypothetical protein
MARMSEGTAKNHINEMGWGIDVELSERELLSIGKIVALWGSLEHEIFCQTLMCFGDLSVSQLPREMNNMQFSQVLDLWETHVINKVAGKRKEILQKQLKSIRHYHEFRNALVHGMWNWSKAAPEKITATRIRKNEILNTHFTADDLSSLASELAAINFNVRYPGGPEEYANSMAKEGVYLSRRAVCVMTSNPVAADLLPSFPFKNINKT